MDFYGCIFQTIASGCLCHFTMETVLTFFCSAKNVMVTLGLLN